MVFYTLTADYLRKNLSKHNFLFKQFVPLELFSDLWKTMQDSKLCLSNGLYLKTLTHISILQYHINLPAMNVFLYYKQVIYNKVT